MAESEGYVSECCGYVRGAFDMLAGVRCEFVFAVNDICVVGSCVNVKD